MERERVEAPPSLMGAPDGPHIFVESLGLEVPSFVDPREDLIVPTARGFKRLNYHVPFNMRGFYKPQWLPPRHYAMYGHQYRTDSAGYVICGGQSVYIDSNTKGDPRPCASRAVNRSPYCRNHGGALHPADKRLSSQNVSISKIEPERIEALDRVQKFMSGIIGVRDLDDDEIIGAYVRNDEGRPIANEKLGVRFQQEMVRELLSRMTRFMQMKLPNMVKVLTDIAESDFVEPADRIRAADIIINRTMGKVPDVVFHGVTDKPYETILTKIEGGSREEYRRGAITKLSNAQPLDVSIVDDETELEPAGDSGSNGNTVGSDATVSSELSDRSENTGAVDDTRSRAAIAKEAKERLKRAKTRRFAARSAGLLDGELPFLIEYIPLKSGGFKAKLWPPELQTQAVVDRITAASITI